jgi:hypothetical protein
VLRKTLTQYITFIPFFGNWSEDFVYMLNFFCYTKHLSYCHKTKSFHGNSFIPLFIHAHSTKLFCNEGK